MMKFLKVTVFCVLLVLAAYGAVRLGADVLTARQGEQVAEAASPFVQGAVSATGRQMKQVLTETPPEVKQKQGEELGRAMYPLTKGVMRGQMEAMMDDPQAGVISDVSFEAGKEFSKRVVKPFAQGVATGSAGALLEDLGIGPDDIEALSKHKGALIDAFKKGIRNVEENLRSK
jgi:hypothetical protein